MSKKNYYPKNETLTEATPINAVTEEKDAISLKKSFIETEPVSLSDISRATYLPDIPVSRITPSVFPEDVDIKIKLLSNGQIPSLGSTEAAAYDCYAADNYTIACFDKAMKVRLGFAMQIPEGYHAKLFIRSGIAANTQLRLANAVGIIDSDYRGEVCALIEANPLWIARSTSYNAYLNYQQTAIHIKLGDRICQMIIEKNLPVKLTQVDTLDESERGEGGFGSSGTK